MPPSLRGCLLSAVLRCPVALTPQSSFQAASHPKSYLKRHEIGPGHSPFWPEGKWSKSMSAPLLLTARRASPWEQATLESGRSSLYPVAAVSPLGSSKPVPSCSQNQQALCCPQQSWGCQYGASCTDAVSQRHTSSLLCPPGCVEPTESMREGCLHGAANAPGESQGLTPPHAGQPVCLSSSMRIRHCATQTTSKGKKAGLGFR